MNQARSAQRVDLEAVPAPEQGTRAHHEAFEERGGAGNEAGGEIVLDRLLAAGKRVARNPLMTSVGVVAAEGAVGRADVVIRGDILGLAGALERLVVMECCKDGVG